MNVQNNETVAPLSPHTRTRTRTHAHAHAYTNTNTITNFPPQCRVHVCLCRLFQISFYACEKETVGRNSERETEREREKGKRSKQRKKRRERDVTLGV